MHDVERIPVKMRNNDLNTLPRISLPRGFRFATYRTGDEVLWAEIEASVDEFPDEDAALRHFQEEFGEHRDEMEKRCQFVCDAESGERVGTATAWYGKMAGKTRGRLHWVAVKPAYQGRGLGKALVFKAVHLLSELHDSAYLTSQTTSYVAIAIYLDFGFEPYITSERCRRGWRLLASILDRPQLLKYI